MIINYLCKIFSKLTCDLQSVSSEVMHNYLHFFYIFYVKSFFMSIAVIGLFHYCILFIHTQQDLKFTLHTSLPIGM